jgi:aminomethyltransferase
MIEFAGWRLPSHFTSVAEETQRARSAAVLFDITHMGLIRVYGWDARSAVSRLLTRDLTAVPLGRSAYALLCNDSGGIVDDLMAMVESDEAVRLVVNAANHEKDAEWLSERLPSGGGIGIDDLRGRTFGAALQGPRAEETLEAAGAAGAPPQMFGAFDHARLGDADILVSRTGYTGEDGFEVFGAAADAPRVWQTLLEVGQDYSLLPAGLAARDVLRQEMGYPLWGQDIDEETTPLEAGLRWVVDWQHDFVGRSALEGRKPRRRRIGFRVEEQGIARAGAAIFRAGGRIGQVTSGTYSHNLKAAIGQGYVDADAGVETGAEIEIEVRERRLRSRVARLPLLPRRTRPSWAELARKENP